ncbi:hypothetical protein [Embleya sp. NPDC005971]|uniref:hypothetical protein n=1 Tax=Embleya sp. NPDC005971 TaxID=3156724 RepID=UPI0034023614
MRVIRVQVIPDGSLLVRGRPVVVPVGMSPEDAAIDHVRAVVATIDEPARVEIERPDGSAVVVVVELDGSVAQVPIAMPAQPAAREDPALPVPRLLRGLGSVPAVASVDPESAVGRPAPGSGSGSGSGGRRPTPLVRETRTRLPKERAQVPPRRRRGLVVGGVAVALVLGSLVAVSLGDGGGSTTKQPVAGTVQGARLRVPVPGWSPAAAWSVPVAAPASGVTTVAAGRAAAAAITPDRSAVLLLDAGDGRTLARVPLPTDGPLHGMWSTAALAIVHVGTHLVVLPLDGAASQPRTLDVPPGSRVSTVGSSLLVTYPANGALILDDSALVDVQIPSGAVQLGADGDTVLAGVPAGSWWRCRRGASSVEVKPVPPRADASVRVVRAGGHDRVLIVWSGPREGVSTVALHDAKSGAVVMQAEVPSDQLVDAAWRWDGGSIAAFGPLVIDLRRGNSRVVPGLRPSVVVDDVLYGRRGASEGVAIPAADPDRVQSLGQDGPLPWGGTARRLLVVSTSDQAGSTALYALERSS